MTYILRQTFGNFTRGPNKLSPGTTFVVLVFIAPRALEETKSGQGDAKARSGSMDMLAMSPPTAKRSQASGDSCSCRCQIHPPLAASCTSDTSLR